MTTAKISHSNKVFYHPEELRRLEQCAYGKIDDIIEQLGLSNVLKRRQRYYEGVCPIHGGDKTNAFNLFHTGDEIQGNWRCFTNGCEKIFQPTIIGFIRAYISKNKYGWTNRTSQVCPFKEAVEFFVKLTNAQITDINWETVEKEKFVRQVKYLYEEDVPESNLKVNKKQITDLLKIPSDYFQSRAYSKSILEKYYIGDCICHGREMCGRAVVPVFDDNFEYMIGCTGRSLFPLCEKCLSYHNPTNLCPTETYIWQYAKWRNNKGFKGERNLFNFWFAKEHIERTKVAVIVESPGNVLRLEESDIHNSVATFGAHLTNDQRLKIDKSGAMALVVLTDPDKAGDEALKQIRESCGKLYQIRSLDFGKKDIGDMSVSQVKDIIVPFIRKVERGFE